MRQLSRVLPRKLQEVPGILQGGIGWQGIVPARAAKMGSIAGGQGDREARDAEGVLQQLEPDPIAEHIVKVFEPDMPAMIERHAARAARCCGATCRRAPARPSWPGSRRSCRRIVHTVTDEIGEHIDQLLDPKIMVINHFQNNPGPGGAHLPRLRAEELT
jgi:hypothetical protein